tara:strand:- start:6532 stop:12213 length:5682 start_codon:yes stop_codon:yes gene_type:complete
MTEETLTTQVLEIVRNFSGIEAKDIACRLNAEKKEVYRVLYDYPGLFDKDSSGKWHTVTEISEPDKEGISEIENSVSAEEQSELSAWVQEKIEELRKKLLDLTGHNPLISIRLSDTSNSVIRVVDELPDVLFSRISTGQMEIVSLPDLEAEPEDEQTKEFRAELVNARLTDDEYIQELEEIGQNDENALELLRNAERKLKDRLREKLGLGPLQSRGNLSIAQHARNHNIAPSYELPDEPAGDKHSDNKVQTLMLKDIMEGRLSRLLSKHRAWEQETGIHVLQVVFGFIEWKAPDEARSRFAPLITLPVDIVRTQTTGGYKFTIKGRGERPELNIAIRHKLEEDFGVKLPDFKTGVNIVDYMTEVREGLSGRRDMKVRRQIAFGVLPSSRIAMWKDLDTSTWKFGDCGIVSKMLGGSGEDEVGAPHAEDYEVDDPDIEARVPLLICDADASQFSVLVDIADGKNLAVEGPPGTGKSQTIVNTIAAALSLGKKVLFVAEKTAALEVVKSRLEAYGIGEFVLPLQANRSTKAEVIESIRKRQEMTSPSRPVDLESKISQFRKKRDQLQEYLDIISSDHENSGYKVHDILGQAMKIRVEYEKLPAYLRNRSHGEVAGIKKQEVDGLLETCRVIERDWEGATNSAPYWAGAKAKAATPLVADIILNLAVDTKEKYEALEKARANLGELGLEKETSIENLQELIACLESAISVTSEYDGALVRKIIESDQLSLLENFLDRASETRESIDWLEQYILDIWAEGLTEKVAAARETLDACALQSLCPDELGLKLSNLDQEISVLDDSSEIFASVKNIVADIAKIPASLLVKCCDLAASYPREIFEMRHDAYEDFATRQIIREGSKKAEELKQQGKELDEFFDMAVLPGREEIGGYAATISEAGFFSFLSSEYRRAKKQFLLITKRSEYEKPTAAKDLKRLCSWMDAVSEYKQDQKLGALLGITFRGIDTDFTYYLNLCSFYVEANDLFRGENNAESYLRDCLKGLTANAIVALPKIPQDHVVRNIDVTPDQAETGLVDKRRARDQIKAGINSIPTYSEAFRNTSQITDHLLDQFEELIPRVHRGRRKLENDHEMQQLLGELFQGVDTSKEQIARTLELSSTILEMEESFRRPCARMLESSQPEQLYRCISSMGEVVQLTEIAEEYLLKLSDESGIAIEAIRSRSGRNGIIRYLNDAAKDRKGLNAHASLEAKIQTLEKKGVRFVLDAIISGSNQPDLTATMKAWLYQKMATNVYESAPILNEFSGVNLDSLRAEIARLDLDIIKSSRRLLAARLYKEAKPPGGVGRGPRSKWTEMSLISHQLSLKRASAPPRDLIKRSSKALLELKPCWMMSPLAVAQYIPKGAIEFDLVVIDEASQMCPQNAIGALARGRQAMVVGDTNQLPPSSFFQKFVSDDDEDEDAILEDSILELANATFQPKRTLRWHYRSRNSSLIAFSNRNVYQDRLRIFSSPDESNSHGGVSLKNTKGLYSGGTNPIEAQKMVEAIKNFMVTQMKKPEAERKSLAVVLMNKKQTELTEELMRNVRLESPAVASYVEFWKDRNDGLESFIVKNLENIQGDERDVIFIGTVYGPEREGSPVMQRFGPVNQMSGKRRLNVLFTRAKHQIVTFSSMTAADINAPNKGAKMLKSWLEYSKTGRLDAGEITKREPDSAFEEFVIEQIEATGCEAIPQVGVKGFFIDIGVRHPQWPHGFLLGVECDGAAYHSSKCARDRDRLRESVLEGLGWKLHRIWSTDWFSDPRTEADKLREVIAATLAEKKAGRVVQPETDQPVESVADESQDTEENQSEIVTEDESTFRLGEEFHENLDLAADESSDTEEDEKQAKTESENGQSIDLESIVNEMGQGNSRCSGCGVSSAYIDINDDGLYECTICNRTSLRLSSGG